RNQAIELATRTPASMTAGDVQKADVIFLAGVPELPEGVVGNLETRVRGGAGLAMFLGPQLKTGFVSQKLHRPQQPAEGLLPLALKESEPFGTGKSGALSNVRWTHPLLSPLQDPVLGDFTKCRFHTFANLSIAPGKNDAVLARFDDDVPAIVDHPFGVGR